VFTSCDIVYLWGNELMNDNDISKIFGERIRQKREERGLNQEDVGDWFKMQKSTVSQWESGRLPHGTIIAELAQRFNTTTDYLLGNTDDPSTPADTIASVLADDKELSEFWKELRQREDLQLLFRQTKSLSPATIKRVIKYIKMVEDEEAADNL
jgi:transcriptional regulator with XRE-family HTH domain